MTRRRSETVMPPVSEWGAVEAGAKPGKTTNPANARRDRVLTTR
jgi:hypothetical protein